MPSILPGFEYDIFISYRHNDNLPSLDSGRQAEGWVTEFVNALRQELASTIKEPLSVYFDKNPHDGLLETHNVDKSLEGKLKCLIFIPIISQTYCDPKSFAWQHEFVAFNKLAKEDQFGRDIKLSNGNVASRILPIKIHDLDAEDKAIIENEISGVLRSIEFIYKEAGVNRPLKATDSKSDNQNKTDYRNQVNKVANAIKEIIIALRNPIPLATPHQNFVKPIPTQPVRKFKALTILLIVVSSIIVGYFVYSKLVYNREALKEDISIAVLIFKNISPDPADEYFATGMTDQLITHLGKVNELKVLTMTSVEQYKVQTKDIRTIASELGVTHVLEGSVRKSGSTFRISVKLNEATTGFLVWSNEYDRKIEDVLLVESDIASQVTGALKVVLTKAEKVNIETTGKVNLTAYELYLKGRNKLIAYKLTRVNSDLDSAFYYLQRSLIEDPRFSQTLSTLGIAYIYKGIRGVYVLPASIDSSKVFADRALQVDKRNHEAYYLLGRYYQNYGKHNLAKLNYDKALAINPNFVDAVWPLNSLNEGTNYTDILEGLSQMQRVIEIDRSPERSFYLRSLAFSFSLLGIDDKSIELYQEATRLDNDSSQLLLLTATRERAKGNYQSALRFTDMAIKQDSTHALVIDEKAWNLSLMGYYQEALKLRLTVYETGHVWGNRIGHLYSKLGNKKLADQFFTQFIQSADSAIINNNGYAISKFAHYDLAGVYAFQGNKAKAYQYLDEVSERKVPLPTWFIDMMKYDPMFESIQKEARFQKIVRKAETKTLAEQARVRNWLESEGMKVKIDTKR